MTRQQEEAWAQAAAGLRRLGTTGDEVAARLTRELDAFEAVVARSQDRWHQPLSGREWTAGQAVQSQDTDDFVDVSEPPTSEVAEASATSTPATK